MHESNCRGSSYSLIALRTGLAAAALDKSSRVATAAAVLGLLAIIVLGMEAADVAVETAQPLKALASLNVAFATLQPSALSLVLRRALAGGDPDALAGAAVAARRRRARSTGSWPFRNSPSDTLLSAAVARSRSCRSCRRCATPSRASPRA